MKDIDNIKPRPAKQRHKIQEPDEAISVQLHVVWLYMESFLPALF